MPKYSEDGELGSYPGTAERERKAMTHPSPTAALTKLVHVAFNDDRDAHQVLSWDGALIYECDDRGEAEDLSSRINALLSGAATPAPTAAHLRRFREQTEAEVFGYVTGVEDAAALYESVNPASDDERIKGSPGAGAMGAVIEYRDKIRELLHAKSPPQGAEE